MPKEKNFRNKHARWILLNLGGMLVLSVVIALAFFRDNGDDLRSFMISLGWSVLICATQWIGNSLIFGWLDKKFSWQTQLAKRAIYGSLALVSYSAIAFILVQILMYRIVQGSLPENVLVWSLRSSWFAILISFMVSMTFVAIAFFNNWKQSLLESERVRSEMLRYKYESLQNQINPHFLFNSFNVLSDLVYEDQPKAVDFIRQMGQLFRYVLDSRDRELVPLGEELAFLDAYAYLLQTRFEEKLRIELDLEASSEEMIVPMTLQLLLENCVKHNEISASQPLKIRISRRGDVIRVENPVQDRRTGPESTGTGLSNLYQQYQFFTDRQIRIEDGSEVFAVEIPILKSETP